MALNAIMFAISKWNIMPSCLPFLNGIKRHPVYHFEVEYNAIPFTFFKWYHMLSSLSFLKGMEYHQVYHVQMASNFILSTVLDLGLDLQKQHPMIMTGWHNILSGCSIVHLPVQKSVHHFKVNG